MGSQAEGLLRLWWTVCMCPGLARSTRQQCWRGVGSTPTPARPGPRPPRAVMRQNLSLQSSKKLKWGDDKMLCDVEAGLGTWAVWCWSRQACETGEAHVICRMGTAPLGCAVPCRVIGGGLRGLETLLTPTGQSLHAPAMKHDSQTPHTLIFSHTHTNMHIDTDIHT